MTEQKSPFVVGARMAVRDNRDGPWREAFVAKVYKNGRFVLRDSVQQWRPFNCHNYGSDALIWHARKAGQSAWDTSALLIWDDTTAAQIAEENGAYSRRNRWAALMQRLRFMRAADATDEMLDQIEAALPKLERGT